MRKDFFDARIISALLPRMLIRRATSQGKYLAMIERLEPKKKRKNKMGGSL
ncbi:MAG: hypothetical protein ACLVJ6_00610 [Merdibacter sp.]